MRRPAATVYSLALAGGLCLSTSPAHGQEAADAEASADAGLPADQRVCLSQSFGAPCNSQSAHAGGTCIQGCCETYPSGGDGTPAIAACLACSDGTATDVSFSGTCFDAGGSVTTGGDSGPIILFFDDSGAPGSSPHPSSGGGCSASPSLVATGGATGPAAGALTFLAALGLLVARRRRASR
jgi:hypothetical protein